MICPIILFTKTRCKGVVYGLIGGRDVFTCELYEKTTLNELIYTPNINIYLPKRKSDCKANFDHIQNLAISEPEEKISKRKANYLALLEHPNPFAYG
ncbi:unnamed protein product [Onchocerca flexuosa]|uniref:Uncharacterized protein n=1 Tax=Onchocerca flexuosa TaxID=387005 RepID=A0A183HMC6_9BILA|nr:unnamed protein product [Onchocerca flexuosa]